MERLSGDDTRILRLESEAIAGHTLKLAIVEPGHDGQPLTVERVRRLVEGRLQRLPRARQRLAPTPLRLAPPVWVDDPHFDVRNHVRAATGVGDRDQLVRLAGQLMAERLDHSRPLWCIDVAGPLGDGRTGLIVRIHHCLADGVTCLRMLSELLWDTNDASEPLAPAAWQPESTPGRLRLLASGAASRFRAAGGALSAGARAAAAPRSWRDAGSELAVLPSTLRRELWPLGADTALDRRIGADRELAFTACELADLKRIEHAAGSGVTVNDVVLTMVAGAIRRWLEARHEPLRGMRVQIPVSMHHRGEHSDELGNRDSFLFCDLPVAEPDPRKRLAAINAETLTRKQHHDADELYSFFHTLSHIRPLYGVASKLAAGPRGVRALHLQRARSQGARAGAHRTRRRALLGRRASRPARSASLSGLARGPDGFRLLHGPRRRAPRQ